MKRLAVLIAVSCLILSASLIYAADKKGTVTYDIALNVKEGAKTASLYLPYPVSDKYQNISDVKISGNYSSEGIYHDYASGSNYLIAKWNNITEKPRLEMSFDVDSHYQKGGMLQGGDAPLPVDVKPYLAANDYLPSDNEKVKQLASQAVKDKKDYLARARAIYDWTIANTHRDPNVVALKNGILQFGSSVDPQSRRV